MTAPNSRCRQMPASKETPFQKSKPVCICIWLQPVCNGHRFLHQLTLTLHQKYIWFEDQNGINYQQASSHRNWQPKIVNFWRSTSQLLLTGPRSKLEVPNLQLATPCAQEYAGGPQQALTTYTRGPGVPNKHQYQLAIINQLHRQIVDSSTVPLYGLGQDYGGYQLPVTSLTQSFPVSGGVHCYSDNN